MVKNKKIAVDYLEARIHLDETIKREQATQPKLCDAAKNITKQSDIFIKKKDKDIKLSQLTKMLASTNEVLEKPDDFTTLDTYSNNLRPIIASKTRTGKNLAAAGTLLLGLAVLFIVPAIISIHIGMFTIPLGLLAIGIGYLLHKKANNAKNCLQPFSIFADKKRHQHYEQIKKQNEANKFKTSLKTFMDAKKKNSPEQKSYPNINEDNKKKFGLNNYSEWKKDEYKNN